MGEIRRVGVVGSGRAAAGIAEICARAGVEVLLDAAAVPPRTVPGGITVAADLVEFADRELVLEVVAGGEPTRLADLDPVIDSPEAVLASSTIAVWSLLTATRRPAQVIGLRFLGRRRVELTPTPFTSEDTRWRAEAFVIATLRRRAVSRS